MTGTTGTNAGDGSTGGGQGTTTGSGSTGTTTTITTTNTPGSSIAVLGTTVLPAYGLQFECTFINEMGNLIDIQILGKAFTGAVTQITGGDQPCVINYPTEYNRTKGIRGSECILTMISQVGFTLYDIYTQDNRQYQVQILIDSSPYWTGFIDNDFSTEPFQQIGTYEISIKATCGLGGLSGVKFLNASGYYLFGYVSVAQLIGFILQKTGLGINYVTGVNIYETTMSTSGNALDQVYVNTQRFFDASGSPMYCSDVLESLCQTFGATIFQRSGQWWFIRQAEMPIMNAMIYTPLGVFVNSFTANFSYSGYGPSSTLKMINADQQISYDMAWGEVKQNYNFAFLLTAVQDALFYAWSSPTTLLYWGNTFTSGGNGPVQYSTYAGAQKVFPNGAFFPNCPAHNIGDMTQYINSNGISCIGGDSLNTTIEFYDWDGKDATSGYVSTSLLFNIYFIPTGGGTTQWLSINSGNSVTSWTSTQPTSAIDAGSYRNLGLTYTKSVTANSFSFSITNGLPPAPTNGSIGIRMYGGLPESDSNSTSLLVACVSIYKLDPANATGSNSNKPIVIGQIYDVLQTASTYTYKPDDKTLLFGDSVSPLYAGALCTNTTGTVTKLWARSGVTESKLLMRIVTESMMDLHKRPYRIFTGSSKGAHYAGGCYLVEGLQGSNPFLQNGSTIDLKTMEGTLVMTEHEPTTGVYSSTIGFTYNKNKNFQS